MSICTPTPDPCGRYSQKPGHRDFLGGVSLLMTHFDQGGSCPSMHETLFAPIKPELAGLTTSDLVPLRCEAMFPSGRCCVCQRDRAREISAPPQCSTWAMSSREHADWLAWASAAARIRPNERAGMLRIERTSLPYMLGDMHNSNRDLRLHVHVLIRIRSYQDPITLFAHFVAVAELNERL